MPLIEAFVTACSADKVIETVLVRLTCGDAQGWGESASGSVPTYSPEYAANQFALSRDVLAPLLLGKEINTGRELQQQLGDIKGNPFAKAAFDLAWWDLHAQMQGQPLWKVLGGERNIVEVGADFGVMESISALIAAVAQSVEQGYKRVKLKCLPGWDLDMVRAVRKEFPDTVLHIDCNSAYSLEDLVLFEKLDELELAMIEQPLNHDDLVDHSQLQRRLRTPICLDESITSVDKARKAIDIGACGWVNIKPGRVGGITNAVEIHGVCAKNAIPCWVGSMLESAVGSSHLLALATLPNIKYPSDIFPTSRFYPRDLGFPPMTLFNSSQFKVSDKKGIGAAPDPGPLAEMAIEQAVFG